ncbi:IS1/IS1595 family N-terminal zinc-binding domain-containing protein [Desulfotalea psychrophila]
MDTAKVVSALRHGKESSGHQRFRCPDCRQTFQKESWATYREE